MAKAYGTLRVWRSHTCLTGPQVIKEFYAMGPVWACVHEWLGLTVESPELKVLLLCVYGRTAWKQVVLASVRLFCLNFSQNWNYSRLTRSRGSEPASTKAGYTQSGVTPLLICLCFSCFDTWMPACWGRSCPKPHWSWDEILSGRLRENTCESLLRVLSAYKKTWTMITWGKNHILKKLVPTLPEIQHPHRHSHALTFRKGLCHRDFTHLFLFLMCFHFYCLSILSLNALKTYEILKINPLWHCVERKKWQ